MTIGILTDRGTDNRVPLLPEHIKTLSSLKCKVLVENSSGESAFVSDLMYKEAGAEIKSSKDIEKEAEILNQKMREYGLVSVRK